MKKTAMVFAAEKYGAELEIFAVSRGFPVQISRTCAQKRHFSTQYIRRPLGLKHYQIHRIDNSPWLAELEQRNAIHPQHDKQRFPEDAIHYVFTFQDSTLECIVIEGQFWHPKVQVLTSEQTARDVWRELINAVGT